MPRPRKPARLWLRPARTDAKGRVTHETAWVILDGGRQISTGCGHEDGRGAERAFQKYLAEKGIQQLKRGLKRRNPEDVLVSEVIARYLTVKSEKVARPHELGQRSVKLLNFWGEKTCDDITSITCDEYVRSRTGKAWASSRPDSTGNAPRLTSTAGARRELEDLRAAIRLAVDDQLLNHPVKVFLPAENPEREEWLTHDEVATLCRVARETVEQQRMYRGSRAGQVVETSRRPLAHVERFIRVAVQTGTRSGAICEASFEKEEGRPWVDLENGVFHRRPPGTRDHSNKRYPPVKLSDSLMEEMKGWRDGGARYVVELGGQPADCKKGFATVVRKAGLSKEIVRHTLRHTAATWMMQAGIPLAEAAGYLGMSLETIQRRYAHHHPDYHMASANALSERANRAGTDAATANVTPMNERKTA
ncbi:Phage integrase family protein [Faunimonas pinastri]|uniref:Phage integrase family protein n=1 Tax=Faunimonas pinastri TaxID=1855383 RepID=A0A1H9QIJ2_9HYPH|nr:tyrosine-type recombinase/integrase [Faunimonas pinastri]SER59593.1 Phage integrase family protein [Faunimonas pinastri]